MAHYRYACLLPAGAQDAENHNQSLLGADTLGIEVTEETLAARCGLGNIDPQHDGSGSTLAAIEAALDWPFPARNAILATIRPDLDSIGAMAVMTMRSKGQDINQATRIRIAAIAKIDRFDRGPWPGPRSWPVSPGDLAEDIGGGDTAVLAAAVRDMSKSMEDRVSVMRSWLEVGTVPAELLDAARNRANMLWDALKNGELQVNNVTAPGEVVEIKSTAQGALRLGYRLAPVVMAINPQFEFPADGSRGKKYTIAQFDPGWINLTNVVEHLSRREQGWGGSATIVGSPQGHPSRLEPDQVMSAIMSQLAQGKSS